MQLIVLFRKLYLPITGSFDIMLFGGCEIAESFRGIIQWQYCGLQNRSWGFESLFPCFKSTQECVLFLFTQLYNETRSARGEVVSHPNRLREAESGRYIQIKEKQNNAFEIIIKLALILCLSVIVLFIIGYFVLGYIYRSIDWERIPVTNQDKVRIATEELLLPELSDYIDNQYRRSFRDTAYFYDTVWFDDIDRLFDVLSYSDESVRTEVKNSLLNNKIDTIEFNTLECGVMDVYRISESDLPTKNEQLRGDGWQYYYDYEYYVLVDTNSCDRAKLACVKSGF